MTPARSPLGAFYRSPLGVRGASRFAWMDQYYYDSIWSTGIAVSSDRIVFVGAGYRSVSANSSNTGSGLWTSATLLSDFGLQRLLSNGKIISVAYGSSGFMSPFVGGPGYLYIGNSANGKNWETALQPADHLDAYPYKIFYGNGIYAFKSRSILVYDTAWSVVTPTGDALYDQSMFVFHKKTNQFEAESSDSACYSSDAVAWVAHATEVAHGFVDADYDVTTDKSLAVSIAAASFDLGGYISSDAISWTRIDSEPYNFCFAGGGKLFFGRPRYDSSFSFLPGDYAPKLVMSANGGTTWQDVTGVHDPANGRYFKPYGGAYFKGKYFLTGRFGVDAGNIGSRVVVSSDGINWQSITGVLEKQLEV